MEVNNKYIIKVIAPWMIDELVIFSKHTKVDVILLQEQEDFYQNGLERMKKSGINVLTRPFSYKNFIKKSGIVIVFFFSNLFKFRPDYNFVIGIKSILLFLKMDLSIFSKQSNIHAQFATQSAIIALLIKKYYNNEPEYSFTFHAYDIYFNNKWFELLVEECSNAFSISAYNIDYVTKKYLASKKITLARLGVFRNEITRVETKKNDVFTLGLMSWFFEKKGINYLLESFKWLKENNISNIKLILSGDGPFKDEYVKYIEEQDLASIVDYIGPIDGDEKINFYNSLDVFILPSISLKDDQDGIPVVLMEAIAYGLPIISTDVSGIPEICINEYNGLLIEEKSTEEITKAIIYMRDHRNKLDTYSKNSVLLSDEYDIEINSKEKLITMNWI